MSRETKNTDAVEPQYDPATESPKAAAGKETRRAGGETILERLKATEPEAARAVGNAGQELLQAQAQGFHGFVPDPTPNYNYTFEGQANEPAPTPETDRGLRREAAKRGELPADVPYLPKDQAEFEALVEHNHS